MPRVGRLHIVGGCYHVMGRGLENRDVFKEDVDKQDFLNRLGISLKKSDARCFAWALMSNHYHLLIRVGSKPLSRVMAPLLTGYATKYNHRHNRCGYVFQNRFKSILCEEDEYLLRLVRYIHLNPLKAGILKELTALDIYPWTGHAGMLGNAYWEWHAIEEVLHLFSAAPAVARRQYRRFVASGIEKQELDDLSGGGLVRSYGGWESVGKLRAEHVARIGDERILGNADFVEYTLKQDSLDLHKQTGYAQDGVDLSLLCEAVCQRYHLDKKLLGARGRKNAISLARQLIAYFAVTELGVKPKALMDRLNVSQSTVSRMIQRGRETCERDQIRLSQFL